MSDQPDELSAGDRREALETAHLMIAISRRVGRMTNAQIAELVTAADQILEPLPVPAGEPTYRLLETCIQCRLCGAVSFNAGDMQNRYCGRCHLFHDQIAITRALAASAHHCQDWTTARGRCAVCHARIPAAPARDQAP